MTQNSESFLSGWYTQMKLLTATEHAVFVLNTNSLFPQADVSSSCTERYIRDGNYEILFTQTLPSDLILSSLREKNKFTKVFNV